MSLLKCRNSVDLNMKKREPYLDIGYEELETFNLTQMKKKMQSFQ